MSKVKNQHYLSRCISKNFITKDNKKFYEYDCNNKKIKEKNIENLFSARRIWGQDFEQILSKEYENKLSVILNKYANININRVRIPFKSHFEETQFNGLVVENEDDRIVLSKLLIQQLLLQKKNKGMIDDMEEKNLSYFFKYSKGIAGNIVLVEINPLMFSCPLILIDTMSFAYFVPDINKKDIIGHIQFMFPITPYRFLIWGNEEDLNYFCYKYRNIHYLNLCRIEQQEKKCRIATQDKEYLELLVKQIDEFSTENTSITITAIRDI